MDEVEPGKETAEGTFVANENDADHNNQVVDDPVAETSDDGNNDDDASVASDVTEEPEDDKANSVQFYTICRKYAMLFPLVFYYDRTISQLL